MLQVVCQGGGRVVQWVVVTVVTVMVAVMTVAKTVVAQGGVKDPVTWEREAAVAKDRGSRCSRFHSWPSRQDARLRAAALRRTRDDGMTP